MVSTKKTKISIITSIIISFISIPFSSATIEIISPNLPRNEGIAIVGIIFLLCGIETFIITRLIYLRNKYEPVTIDDMNA